LRAHRREDFGMADAQIVDTVAAEAVDPFAPQNIADDGAIAGPFQCGEVARLGDGLAILHQAGREMVVEVPDGLK